MKNSREQELFEIVIDHRPMEQPQPHSGSLESSRTCMGTVKFYSSGISRFFPSLQKTTKKEREKKRCLRAQLSLHEQSSSHSDTLRRSNTARREEATRAARPFTEVPVFFLSAFGRSRYFARRDAFSWVCHLPSCHLPSSYLPSCHFPPCHLPSSYLPPCVKLRTY